MSGLQFSIDSLLEAAQDIDINTIHVAPSSHITAALGLLEMGEVSPAPSTSTQPAPEVRTYNVVLATPGPTPSPTEDYQEETSERQYVYSAEQRAYLREASRRYRARRFAERAILRAENAALKQQQQASRREIDRLKAMVTFYSLVTTPCPRCNGIILAAGNQAQDTAPQSSAAPARPPRSQLF